jgi:hypothetical protein
MKTLLLTATIVVMGYCGYAQTKGTNALGFGISSRQTKDESNNGSNFNNTKENFASLTYGRFIKENTRLGFTTTYSYHKQRQDIQYDATYRGYGAGVNYQKYYPVFKKFYVVAGGKVEYSYTKGDSSFGTLRSQEQNYYNLGVYGSAAYFLSKRFALEARLLSADIAYSKNKSNGVGRKLTESTFNLSSSGAINNLGFQIYFLF